ncbi:MAG: hypothetical protein IT198_08365 [Acidimicrobiia bacterium]|nr:hypothetical protein [Acidimicrobiia bacterium]
MPLTPAQRRSRFRLDWTILDEMARRCDTFRFGAFASHDDLAEDRNRVTRDARADEAVWYRLEFRIPTLIGPDRFADSTVIGANLTSGEYPFAEPATWIISDHVPFSPHFKRGAPVCLGDMAWKERRGRALLGHLVEHVARLLNWDEVARGGGYVGWNPEAVSYHAEVYGTRPLNSGIRYPTIPVDLISDVESPKLFRFGRTPETGRGPINFKARGTKS